MTSKCSSCGAQVADSVSNCPKCGSQMPNALPTKGATKMEPEQLQKIMLIVVAVGAGGTFLAQGKILFAIAAIAGVVLAHFHLSKKKKDDGRK